MPLNELNEAATVRGPRRASASFAILAATLAVCLSGCDRGTPHYAPSVLGPTIHLIATNLGSPAALPANGRIEMSFDRLLLPESIGPQTFVLVDGQNHGVSPAPVVAYDPAARVVTVTPAAGSLTIGQSYTLRIESPQNAADLNGLRAFDGPTLSSDSPSTLGFTAAAAVSPTPTPIIDYCRDIAPAVVYRCDTCHAKQGAFAGLELDTPANTQATALGRVAQGSNTGPMAMPQPPLLQFAVDVPIIDPGSGPSGMAAFADAATPDGGTASGNPGHSWLMYKILMAVPATCEVNASVGYPPCDGGVVDSANPPPTPTDITGIYEVACSDAGATCPQPLDPDERQRLADMITGREMPYPTDPNAPLMSTNLSLTEAEVELISLWIAQGAPMPESCP